MATTTTLFSGSLAPATYTSPTLDIPASGGVLELDLSQGQNAGPVTATVLALVNGQWQSYGTFQWPTLPPGNKGATVAQIGIDPGIPQVQGQLIIGGTKSVACTLTLTV